MAEIIPIEYQVAIFPNNYIIDHVGSVGAKLMRMTDYFSPDSIIMNPFDMNAPAEIERIRIWSKDKDLMLSISPYKLGFYWVNTDLKESYTFNKNTSMALITEVFKNLDLDSLKFDRAGFITNIIKKTLKPTEIIKKHLLRSNINNLLTNTQIKLTYKTSLDINKNCNLHVTIGSGYLNNNKEEKVIRIQHDINTYKKEKQNWSINELNQFIEEAEKKSKTNLIYSAFFSDKEDEKTI